MLLNEADSSVQVVLYLYKIEWVCSVIASTVIYSCSHSQISPLYQPSFWTSWPVWHQREVPGGVPPPPGQEASSSGGAPAKRRCSPLKHSCLWAVARTRKTKTPFMWRCERWVETQLGAQSGGSGQCDWWVCQAGAVDADAGFVSEPIFVGCVWYHQRSC